MTQNPKPTPAPGGAVPAGKTANQRGAARLAAVQALYQMEIGHQSLEDTLSQFSAFHLGREIEGEQYLPADADFFRQIVGGVARHQLQIDPAIDGALTQDWPVTRIDATLRAILRAAAFELLRRQDIPPGVVITEYVDVAKAFYEDDAPALVNGVLDAISKTVKRDKA
jgi:N utilization substance protein B